MHIALNMSILRVKRRSKLIFLDLLEILFLGKGGA